MDENNVEIDKPVYGIDLMTKQELLDEIYYLERKAEHHAKELDLAKCWYLICVKKKKERFGE